MAEGTLLLVNDETFDAEVLRARLPVVVDFFAQWSAPSKAAEAILKGLSASLAGRVKFTKVDVGESERVAQSFGIHTIPTYLFVDHGRERGREVGHLGSGEFRTVLQRHFPEFLAPRRVAGDDPR